MAVELNHTIIPASDPAASAAFLAGLLGLPEPSTFGPFTVVQMSNDVSLDFMRTAASIEARHYAFKVSDDEFGQIFERIRQQGLPYWADPQHSRPGEVNHNDGGQGVYFPDPDGHNLEILTRDYGSGS